ncbi:gliding motility-associated C-terminal domain-containing protein [Chitinophaga sp. sic0106]|uniref:gliding motility-associated C-terminal domain-containing protein n=1 Tax=Chitinophaga sp. sic0106 TaxID=2854785 RepID=UPI001C45163D|nr:gliding motility-associated C-terminal domain-containing protein [Chitinophaga sp. sic0106]MBV7530129.1 gliding motility-associated C-terminal domain-containing protein [Chitinophaga sp. sic0106]
MKYHFSDEVILYRKPMKKIYFLKVSPLLLWSAGLILAVQPVHAGTGNVPYNHPAISAVSAALPKAGANSYKNCLVKAMEPGAVSEDAVTGVYVTALSEAGGNGYKNSLVKAMEPGAVSEDVVPAVYVAALSEAGGNSSAAPPVVNMESFTIRDDAASGTLVGQLTASGSNLQWQLADDETKGAFRLDASGRIYVDNITLLQTNRGKMISLFVSASDGLETSNLAEIVIAIQDTYINQPPTLDAIADKAICSGNGADTIQLTGMSAVEPDQTYSLVAIADLPMLDYLQVTNDGQLTYQVKTGINAGTCMITVMIKDNGGVRNGGQDTRTRSFNVTVNGIPAVAISSDKGTVVPKGELLVLTASGADNYSWSPAAGLEGETGAATVSVKPVKTTRYEVVATNNSGCRDTANIEIRVVADFIIRANNVITPNNDGRNDRWVIQSLEDYPENEAIITDRTGRVIFKQKNYSNTWDGKLNGQPLAEGTYYYTFSVYNNITKTTDVAKGYITILGD